ESHQPEVDGFFFAKYPRSCLDFGARKRTTPCTARRGGFYGKWVLLAASDRREEASQFPPPIKSWPPRDWGSLFFAMGTEYRIFNLLDYNNLFLEGIGINLHLDLELLFLANMIVGYP